MSDFPDAPDQLGPDEITGYLRAAGRVADARVVAVDHAVIGTGKMGDNARYQLTWEGDAAGAPTSVVAKFPASDERAREMAGAQGAYFNEVMFYRDLAPGTSIRTPAIYGSELSDDRSSFLLLMEDLSPATPGSQLVGESHERARIALREAAKLAAAYYGRPVGERPHVIAPGREDGGAFGQALMEQSWPTFLDRFGATLSPRCVAFGERYVAAHAHFVTRFDGPRTLIHGDFRSENILFHEDTAAVVDWQTTSESSALADVAYFLGGSLEIDDRRAWERELIGEFRTQLEEHGASLPFQECWDQYREFAMHGLMITVLGATFSTPDERSDEMFLAMIRRHLQHCIDLDAGEFLP